MNIFMIGRGGADQLVGEGGNDRLEGGVGADILSGGADSDTASYAFAQTGVRVDILNTALNTGDAAGDRFSSVENISGSNFADILSGDGFGNILSGGAGNDALNGRSGIDRLDGGTGNDVLTGGTGVDTFVFKAGYDVDRVLDFANDQDRLDLRGFDFGSFAEVKALATDTAGGDLRLDFGSGDVLTVDNFSLADFTANDVLL
jgi:Ca2+-binding RTX toxin-like protein